jgi:hypothetical protein
LATLFLASREILSIFEEFLILVGQVPDFISLAGEWGKERKRTVTCGFTGFFF